MTNEAAQAALMTAKVQQQAGTAKQIVLSTGYRATVRPVSGFVIQQAQGLIKDPAIPKVALDDGREVENNNDPAYLAALDQANNERGQATIDAVLLMGVDIELPEDDGWLKRLKLLARRGLIDLTGFDLEDELDQDYLFKKFIALGGEDDVAQIMAYGVGVPEDQVKAAIDNFRRTAARRANPQGAAPEPEAVPQERDQLQPGV